MSGEQSWNYVDKSTWPSGPWNNEPDKVQWVDTTTRLVCMARRNARGGNWCGYVGVSANNPVHGKSYDDVDADVHGGLTYAAPCDGDEERGICHRPEPGEPDDLWWFGFDCAHCYDLRPAPTTFNYADGDEVYRDLKYVKDQCARLASQLIGPRP